MTKSTKKSRKSISVAGLTYRRLQFYCREHGKKISAHVEELIEDKFDALGIPNKEKYNLVLWDCTFGKQDKLVAAHDEKEAMFYAGRVMGCRPELVTAKVSPKQPDKSLVPGVLPPDEVRDISIQNCPIACTR